MREWLISCLKKGGPRLYQPLPSHPYRSHRRLHSAFWSHGAGNIDLPSWWNSLLQITQAGEENDVENRGLGPQFLEFLYPSQTSAFIRKYAMADLAVLKRHQRIRKVHQSPRDYVSVAVDDSGLSHNIAELQNNVAEQTENLKHVARGISSIDVVRRESLLARLDELLLHDDPDAQHLPLWRTYQELRSIPEPLLPRQLVRMMRCLSRSRTSIDQERLVDLFTSIPIPERRFIHYSYSVSAALRLDRLTFALQIHKEALARRRGCIGTSALIQYAFGKNLWQVAIETWQESLDKQGSTLDSFRVWDGAGLLPLPELWSKASSALDYALQIRDLTGEDAARSARDFALQITLQILLLVDTKKTNLDDAKSAFVSDFSAVKGSSTRTISKRTKSKLIARIHPNVDRHEDMINKAIALQAPAKQLYTDAIYQVLLFKARAFDALALKYYRALRDLSDGIPLRATVIAMLRRLCAIQSSAGIFMLLNDFRFYYGDIPLHLLESVIPVLAHQGNVQAVDDLLQEYHSKTSTIVHSRVANAFLYVYNRRGETRRLPEAFHSLRTKYNFEPDRRSWNTIVASYARIGDVDAASKWFNDFLDSNIKPDKHTFIYMMSMFAKRGDPDAVKQLLRQSAELGISTDMGMIDCLVLAQVHNGETQNAENLIEEAITTVENVPMSSRTRMWNYVLNAYALRADLDKVTNLHRRMRESGIPSNGTTFAALMQCLAITGRPRAAYQILTEIMPQADVSPTPLHYGILMSGYLRRKQYGTVLRLYSQMLEKDLKPTMATQNYLIRAAAQGDMEERARSSGSNDQALYARAQAVLEQTLTDISPMDLAVTEPVKFVGHLRLDDAFTVSHFAYMVYMYGRSRALDKATEMYDRYIEKRADSDMDLGTSPPINMLGALMLASRNAADYETVEKCWRLSLSKAEILARRTNANTSEPGWVLPARRYMMNRHLRYYISSLEVQQRLEDIERAVDHLCHCGFALDSRSWNQYIVILLKNNQSRKAFDLCEKELMPDWEGWAPLGHFGDKLSKNMQRRQSRHLNPHRRHPQYDTMVHLAAAFVSAQSGARDRWGRTEIDRLAKVAPRTVKAVYNLPRVDDNLQGTLLKGL